MSSAVVRILFDFSQADPELSPEELEDLTRWTSAEIEDLVDSVSLVRESELPEGGKSALGGFLLGILKTEVSKEGFKKLGSQLGERFGSRIFKGNASLKMELEAPDGTKLKIEAGSQDEFAYIMQQAQAFINQSKE
jgi:hypothetical protein